MTLKIAGIAVCGVLAYLLLKNRRPEFAALCELAAVALVFFLVADELIEIKDYFSQLSAVAGIESDYLSVLIKSLGTALVTQLASDTARDAGESALASKIEFAGRVVILYCSLPLLKSVAEMIGGLTENM